MPIKLFDSELKIMECLWSHGQMPAGQLVKLLKEEVGWNRNTTYTVINKLVKKKAVKRLEPNFICQPLLSKAEVQHQETNELINKMFNGSKELFFSCFLNAPNMSNEDIDSLKRLLEKMK